ncbi:SH2 domain protein [Dictyocaulus viviparus]|uniref:SH2 domain protein n=1 Tax=Dictyocaulus viviparus TaxID=29172 RepID=A0A0D8XXX6_DICVI|nr:SH2 domain protein [Dictyocaulus viviparus]
MRKMAQKAREQHRQLIRTSTSILPALNDTKATSLREAIKNLPRPPKPKSRAAIVDWFKRDEWPRGTGQDPKTKMPAPWFHGIISRDQAEILLQDKPTGSFLVRVSERIWGYTVSYVVGDGTYKHFLVERIPEGYQFLGTNQVVHDQLFDLISYHETAPITAKGGEVLKWSVGQIFRPPDYHDIVPEFAALQTNRVIGRF